MSRTIGYLRVSCKDQDVEKFKSEILLFANQKRLGNVDWIEEKVSGTVDWRKRELGKVLVQLKPGDTIITPEISRFARSLLQVMEIIEFCRKNEITIYALKGNWTLDNSLNSKVAGTVLALVGEIEKDLISQRTREALEAKRATGVKLGRKPGPGKSRLDPFKPEIVALLKNGSRKSFVAARYGVDAGTLQNWLTKNSINATPVIGREMA